MSAILSHNMLRSFTCFPFDETPYKGNIDPYKKGNFNVETYATPYTAKAMIRITYLTKNGENLSSRTQMAGENKKWQLVQCTSVVSDWVGLGESVPGKSFLGFESHPACM
jgi:hypothetical protein